mmetsp:Transcript_102944/g.296445  ORF Transcript_102944/g.296445 Transcript_102944/m.296445 type:complete len:685 (+) Transcript_102944:98-2152(+)
MKSFAAVLAAAVVADLGSRAQGAAASVSPIGKVLAMLSDLQRKIIKEGEVVQNEYSEFAEWCEDRVRDLSHEIKTAKADVENLQAVIDEETASIASLTTRVDELAESIASDESDVKEATEVREKEHADFAAEETELTETIDMIGRAIEVLEREQAKGSASMLQMKSATGLTQALSIMVQAELIASDDAAKLTAFVQDAQGSDDSDAERGAPSAAAYESHSSSINEALQGLDDKAQGQLEAARKKETQALHNYEMQRQALEDAIRFAKKELDEAKKGIAAATEKKSTAEGELAEAKKELAADTDAKASLHHDCMSRAQDFEAETASRGEELKALAAAKKAIEEATSGGSLAQVSMLQVAARAQASRSSVVRLIRDLARKERSTELAQLASRMSTELRRGAARDDVFAKVKNMIQDMIAKLEDEAEADATKKAYCDKELKETTDKKDDRSDEIERLTTKLDKATAKSAQLKGQVAALEMELSKLAKSQAEMDNLRREQHEAFEEERAELEKGLEGIKLALKVLKEYYGKEEADHDRSSGSASGIIGLIEVTESDFSKNLAEITSEEETAAAEYERVSKANEVEKTTKEKDVKFKVKEAKELDKTSAELSADRSSVQTELDAVMEYYSKIQEECVAKPESYEERVQRRDAELAGLRQALDTLESETALVQRRTVRRRVALRGGRLAV